MDRKLEEKWFIWAKKNRAEYVKKFIAKYNFNEYKSNQIIFLAGSPWSWKTEFINYMMKSWFDQFFVHVDLDEIRKIIPWYNWSNADSFQKWAIKIMEMLVDKLFSKGFNVLLDWTFWSKKVVYKNIKRANEKWYDMKIYYVSFDPIIARKYTLWREFEKKRKIPLLSFFNQYYNSYNNIRSVIIKYPNISIYILKKDLTKNWLSSKIHIIQSVKELDYNQYKYKPQEFKFLLLHDLFIIMISYRIWSLFKINK